MVAGAPGFEPGITGPKPVALPLGHAPIRSGDLRPRPRPDGARRWALSLGPLTRRDMVSLRRPTSIGTLGQRMLGACTTMAFLLGLAEAAIYGLFSQSECGAVW